MKSFFRFWKTIIALLLLFQFGEVSSACAQISHQDSLYQKKLFHVYFGAGLGFGGFNNLERPASTGFYIEGGVKYPLVYAGLEFGLSSTKSQVTFWTGGPSPDFTSSPASLFGIHVGVTPLKSLGSLGIGIMILGSTQTITHYSPVTFSEYLPNDVTITRFSVGPDFRLFASQHVVINLAYAMQLGVKIGLDYMP